MIQSNRLKVQLTQHNKICTITQIYHNRCVELVRPYELEIWTGVQKVHPVGGLAWQFDFLLFLHSSNRPFSHYIDQAGFGAFTAKIGCKHYNPPPLTVM